MIKVKTTCVISGNMRFLTEEVYFDEAIVNVVMVTPEGSTILLDGGTVIQSTEEPDEILSRFFTDLDDDDDDTGW